jgi:hypothetical protein
MTEAVKMSLEELFELRASQQMISESNAFKTVPKGMYRVKATKYDISKTAYEGKDPRVTIWFSVDILDPEGKRLAKGSIKVSPDEQRTAKGYLDTQSKLYGQLTKALSLQPENGGEQPSAAEVVQTFMNTPVDSFIALQYQGPKDPISGYPMWFNADTEAEELDCRQKGYKAVNIIRSVQKAN